MVSLLKLHKETVKLPNKLTPASAKLNRSKFKHFRDCVRALDSSHVPAYITSDRLAAYRDRKGNILQNILAVCDFERQFTYIYAR